MKPNNNKIVASAVAVLLTGGGLVMVDQTQEAVPLECNLLESPITDIRTVLKDYEIDEGFIKTRPMTNADKAEIKGCEIAKATEIQTTERAEYRIEITDVEPFEGGVQAFARVWKDGVQIGFGDDGTVDIERFQVFNPPILVEDPKGPIVRIEKPHEDSQLPVREVRFREDPKEALLQVIEQNVLARSTTFTDKNIVSGKVGRTTSTFYPNANVETVSVDGYANNTANASWDTAHDAITGSANDSDTVMYASVGKNSGGNFVIYRAFALFDSSALPDADVISSATLSIYVSAKANGDNDGDDWINVVQSSPATNLAIIATDFDGCGVVDNPTEGATRVDIGSVSTAAYLNLALDSDGLGWISKTSVSKFGIREGHDMIDSAYAGSNSTFNELSIATAEDSGAGTTQDPKLVVEHAAASARRIMNIQ